MPGLSFGAEEEAYAWRTGRPNPAPPTVVGPIRSIVQQKINAQTAVSNQQRIASGVNVPQASGVGYWAPLAPPPPPPPPMPIPKLGEDPYLRGGGDPFRAFQVPGTSPVGDFMDLFRPEAQKPPVNLFNFGLPEEQVTDQMGIERKREELAAQKSRENRETVNMKLDEIRQVEQKQAKDSTLPAEERQALQALKLQLLELPTMVSQDELNPIRIMLRNLGTRADYRIEMTAWKNSKNRAQGLELPTPFPTTGEEFDDMGGLGGFISQPTSKTAGDFDRTPAIFGKLITRDANGVETIVTAQDWIAARIADTKPLPTDDPQTRALKARAAADLISTLSFADKYNSFAQKRDAGYRVQLDSSGNPVAAYILKPDEDALKNLVGEILTDTATLNVVGPIEDWMEAYALERLAIANNATGPYGTGQSSGGGGGGYSRSYGGGGGYGGYGGGGGQITTYYPTDAEVLEPAVGVARARLGRSLTPEEEADFVSFFRGIESSILAAGGAISRVDPQAQAIVWLDNKLSEEAKGQQAGRFIVALMNAFRTGNLNVG